MVMVSRHSGCFIVQRPKFQGFKNLKLHPNSRTSLISRLVRVLELGCLPFLQPTTLPSTSLSNVIPLPQTHCVLSSDGTMLNRHSHSSDSLQNASTTFEHALLALVPQKSPILAEYAMAANQRSHQCMI